MKPKKTFILSLLFTTLALLTSCEKEKKDPPSESIRLVSKTVQYKSSSGSVESDQTIEYMYDKQNRVSKMTTTDEDGNPVSAVITYPSENLMVSGNYTYTLNGNGAITSQSEGEKLMIKCTYDDRGYLQKMEIFSILFTIPVKTSHNYTWENGNVKFIEMEILLQSEPPSSIFHTTAFEYSAIENKPISVDFGSFLSGVPRGWYGKVAKNLPSKIIQKNEDGSESVTRFRYEIDKDSYPVKIFAQEDEYDEELKTLIEY